MSPSKDQLKALITERLAPNANIAEIDQKIWDTFGSNWCVVETDLSGFSRQVAKHGIIHFLQILHESERLILPIITAHDGILVKTAGDSLMIIYPKPEQALESALEMFQVTDHYNSDKAEDFQIKLCVGMSYGKILRIGEKELFGDTVNSASKLGEDTAKAGELLITESVKQACSHLKQISFEKLEPSPIAHTTTYRVIHN